jgi:ATP-dependent helicase HrpA
MKYSRLDMKLSRELFIRHALVQGEWDSKQAFDRANSELLQRLEEIAETSRKPQYMPDDEDVYRFYAARIPQEVVSTRSFEGWWKKEQRTNPSLLTMTREDLLPIETTERIEIPTKWVFGENSYKLEHKYQPGEIEDGLSVLIPIADLPTVTRDSFDWLVPQLREDLIAELIRTLPKSIRKYVVPAADWSKKALATLPENPTEPLLETIAKTLRTLSGTHMTANDFKLDEIPTSLRITYKLVAENKEIKGVSLDLDELKQKFDPAFIKHKPGMAKILIPNTDAIKLRQKFIAEVITQVNSPVSKITEDLSKDEKLAVASVGYRNIAAFVDDVILALVQEELDTDSLANLNPQEVSAKVSKAVPQEAHRCMRVSSQVSALSREASKAISQIQEINLLFVLANQKKHLAQLMTNKLISTAGLSRLDRLPIYLQANKIRTSKLLEDPERDRRLEIELNQAILLFENAGGSLPLKDGMPESIVKARWAIEEFRVSLFAQSLGTSEPVSIERIKKILNS